MSLWILHDRDHERAVLYSSTTERPLDLPGFVGDDAREQAEVFLAWLVADDPCRPSTTDIEVARCRFDDLCSRPGCDHRVDWSSAARHLDLASSEAHDAVEQVVSAWRDRSCVECARLRRSVERAEREGLAVVVPIRRERSTP